MTGQPKKQLNEQADGKQRIMDAAGQLFADKGFAATSISDITEAAGVGRALIYYHFKDKRSLHDSILRRFGQLIIEAAQSARSYEGTALERIRWYVVQFRQLHVDRPNVGRIAMRAEIEGTLTPDLDVREHFKEVLSLLKLIVEEGIAQGELRSVRPEKAVHIIMAMVHSVVMMHIQGQYDDDPDEDIDFAMSILKKGLAVTD